MAESLGRRTLTSAGGQTKELRNILYGAQHGAFRVETIKKGYAYRIDGDLYVYEDFDYLHEFEEVGYDGC